MSAGHESRDYVLQSLGIGECAEQIYLLMLTHPEYGVHDLARDLGISYEQVRAGLDELAHISFARESRDHPAVLRAVRPEVAFSALLRQQELDLAQRLQKLADTKAAMASAVAEYSRQQPSLPIEGAERLLGLDAIHARLEELARDVNCECIAVMPGGAQSQASLDASRPLDEDAMRRGVELLTLYQDSARNDQATCAYARWMTDLGGQVRTAPTIPPRILIFDRRIAVVPIDPDNTRTGALCTREPAILASLIAVFEQAWQSAVPLGTMVARDPDTGLTAQEKELLALLGVGLTDEAAGKRLGISQRTVRRQMAALMERLGASSRFEAGLKAAQRGWL
jgi:DNA-binding CsgD family transcriptional regulator/sugar-specific transcriptional regulator TrmB